jgi:hypothetical protein
MRSQDRLAALAMPSPSHGLRTRVESRRRSPPCDFVGDRMIYESNASQLAGLAAGGIGGAKSRGKGVPQIVITTDERMTIQLASHASNIYILLHVPIQPLRAAAVVGVSVIRDR